MHRSDGVCRAGGSDNICPAFAPLVGDGSCSGGNDGEGGWRSGIDDQRPGLRSDGDGCVYREVDRVAGDRANGIGDQDAIAACVWTREQGDGVSGTSGAVDVDPAFAPLLGDWSCSGGSHIECGGRSGDQRQSGRLCSDGDWGVHRKIRRVARDRARRISDYHAVVTRIRRLH